ncbi:MAG: ABC transporter permease [Planctomycetes bacterium]|nr:ABC transporter permease [Planctomycetota bacterium]MCL4729657.1 ABC transporter permease [Planctomycetota bacterium]
MTQGAAAVAHALVLLARRQLTHDLFRTAVSVAAVAVGVVIVVAVNAVMSGFDTTFVDRTVSINPHVEVFDDAPVTGELPGLFSTSAGGIVTVESDRPRARPARVDSPAEMLVAVRAMPEVAAVAPAAAGVALVSLGNLESGCDLIGIDPILQESVVSIEQDLVAGSLNDLARGQAVILGEQLAQRIGARLHDRVSVQAGLQGRTVLRVVGVLRTGISLVDQRRAYTHLSDAQRLFGLGAQINRLAVRLHDRDNARAVAATLEQLTRRRAVGWPDANTHVLSLLETNKLLTAIVSVGVLVVAAVGILNVLMMLVLEKTPSIALLKAAGYRRGHIVAAFVLQGAALGGLGVVAGCALGYHVVEALGRVPIPRLAMLETDTLLVNNLARHYVLAGGVALLVSVAASVLPAWRAGALDPVAVLRGRN